MKKLLALVCMILILNLALNTGMVSGHGHNFTETKQLIDSGISCDELTDEQLEAIGDYYMEQMHPGEAHDMMDKMMGGEGSDSLRQMHINMAKRLYCDEDIDGMMGSGGMMGMMPMMMYTAGSGTGNQGYSGYQDFLNILYVILLVGLIVLVFSAIIKLWKDIEKKGRKK